MQPTKHKPITRTAQRMEGLPLPTDPNSEGYRVAMAGGPAELRVDLILEHPDGRKELATLTSIINQGEKS